MNHVELICRPSKDWELFINGYRIPDANFSVAKGASSAVARAAADAYLATSDATDRLDGAFTFTDGEGVAVTLKQSDPTPTDFVGAEASFIKQINL